MKIRPANPGDAQPIAEVDAASWRAAYASLMPPAYLEAIPVAEHAEQWAADIAKHGPEGRKRWLVAESDSRIVGYALAGIPTGETRGMLYLLYTLPETWGTGVGLALLGSATEAYRSLRVDEATLWVLRENARARRFYERTGWTATGNTSATDYGGVNLEGVEYRIALG